MPESTIDVERLLAPISEEQPTGVELSVSDFDGPFMRIKDAYDEARKLVKEQQDRELSGGIDSQGQPWRTIPEPDWDTIIELSTSVLEETSKDFRIASWLTEGLLRTQHIQGLRDGLDLCWGLCERYWAEIHPPANEDDGHGVTVGAFSALVSDATFGAVLESPIVMGTKHGERAERSYSAQDHLRAKDLESLSDNDERQRRMEMGHIEMSEFMAIAAVTPPEFHAENVAAIDSCIEKLNELGAFLRENCKDDEYGEPTAPGVSDFREQLEDVRRLVIELRGGETGGVGDEGGADEDTGDSGGVATGATSTKEMTREQAFQQIEKIAQFFERTEPHTPVFFALRQVVRWGRMPLQALLTELIDDHNIMETLRKQIGLPPEETNE